MSKDSLSKYLEGKYPPGSPVLYKPKSNPVTEGIIVSMVNKPYRSYHSFMVKNLEVEVEEVRLGNLTLKSNPLLTDVKL